MIRKKGDVRFRLRRSFLNADEYGRELQDCLPPAQGGAPLNLSSSTTQAVQQSGVEA